MNSILSKLFVISTILIFGCTDSGDISETTNPKEIDQTPICPPKNNYILPKPNAQGVNVFMEVSGSMKGFMPASNNSTTDFQLLIPDLLSRLNRDLPKVNFFVLAQQKQPIKELAITAAKQNIAFGKFSFGNSSTLPIMFDSVLSKSTTNNISILITDAIYSPPSSIAKINQQVLTDISDRISQAVKSNLSFTCFCVKSQFNQVINSPYYLFVIGAPQNVEQIKVKLLESLNALSNSLANKSINEVKFGFPIMNPFYSIVPYADNNASGEPANCPEWESRYLVMENISIKNNPEFWVGLNLSGIPEYAMQKKYLKTNLETIGNELKATMIEDILYKSEFNSKVDDQEDKKIFEKCTHFVKIRITQIDAKRAEVLLSLKKNIPAWISEVSHSDSKNAETIRDRTYGFDNIIYGVADAYRNKESGYFFKDLKLTITKK